jgi:hypothetical protein
MSKQTPSRTLAEQRRALEDIERAIAAQDAQLAAAHAEVNPRRKVLVTARAQQRLQELCTLPERVSTPASAVVFNEWEVIRC